MSLNKYDLTKEGGSWKLQEEGNQRASEVFDDDTKEIAIQKSADYLKSHEVGLCVFTKKMALIKKREPIPVLLTLKDQKAKK